MTVPLERPFSLDGVEYIVIEDGDGHYMQLPKLTTTQRDALSATNGMMIYNTTTGRVEAYQSGAWSAVGGSYTVWTEDTDAAGYNISDLGKLNFDDATTLTISSGTITITQSYHYIDTEGGAAADDLDTINGGTAGDILYLRTVDSARDVTIKHGTGNIVTSDGSDYTMDSTDDVVQLIYDGANWHVVGSAAGGGGGSSTFTGLTDTPSSYTGYAGYSPTVNPGETALEWQSFADMELASRTIYVDADSGSDTTGDGSSSNPYQTYSKALSTVRNVIGDGVTITIHLNAATDTYTPVDTGRVCIGTGQLVVEGELSSQDSGTATGGSATTIRDTSKSWSTDAYVGKLVKITMGGTDYYRIVLSNTSDTLTVIGRLEVTPSSGDAYTIYDWGSSFDAKLEVNQGNMVIQDLRIDANVYGTGLAQYTIQRVYFKALSVRDKSIGLVNTCVIDGQGSASRGVDVNGANPDLTIYRTWIKSCAGTYSGLVTWAPATVKISYGCRIDGTSGSSHVIYVNAGAYINFYSPAVNGATDYNYIIGDSGNTYGVYAQAHGFARQISKVSFSGSFSSGNYGADSSSYGYVG